MINILLLICGSVLLILGLLAAAYPPFQYWWYRQREIDKNKIVAKTSKEYKNIAFYTGLSGMGVALGGGLLVINSLGELGGERLISVAGVLFISGLLLIGLVKVWKKITSKK